MNFLHEIQGNSKRRTQGALSVFILMFFSVVFADSPSVQAAVSRYAYVTGASGISIYTVNVTTGQLRSNGYFYPGSALGAATVDPSGKFFYAADANAVSVYTINATTGVPTPVGSPYACPTGYSPQWITVDPLDRFVYVVNNDSGLGSISAYTLDSETGALTPVAGSPFATGFGPASMVIDPTGKFAYVNNEDDSPGGDVSGYTIDAATGALTAMAGSPFLSGSGALSIALAPSGKFGYVGSGAGAQITAFSINPTTGVPTVVKGSPFMGPGNSYAIVLSTSGKLLYTLGGGISAFTVNTTTGKLKLVTGSPFPAGDNPFFATVDPGDTRLYVTNIFSDEVWTYKIAGSGALTVLNKVRTAAAPGPVALVTGSAAVAYTPKFAYVANQGSQSAASSVSAYTITAASGHLTAVSGSPFADGGPGTFAFASSVVVDPTGRFAYVANESTNDVAAYTIDASTGALTSISGSSFTTETYPISVTVDPTGRFVYVANNQSYNISAFAINTSTGGLTPLSDSPVPTGTTDAIPVSVTVDPTGQFLYVANSDVENGSISVLTIDPATGGLTAVAGSPFADIENPGSVAVDASGRFAYAANTQPVPDSGEQYEMPSFAIDPATGALSPLNSSSNLGAGTPSVVTDPLGQFLYSPQNGDGGILSLSFNGNTDEFSAPIGAPNLCVDGAPAAMTVDPSGKYVYVANPSTKNITACKINQTTGDLNNIAGETAVAAGTSPVSVVVTGTVQ
jgi:6-phosphogluconolactonase (cycloisomerase 2 family)